MGRGRSYGEREGERRSYGRGRVRWRSYGEREGEMEEGG